MKIELIVIGNELLNGKIVDVNISWFTRFLARHCHYLFQASIVADDPDDLNEALERACARSDFVVLTGGLGPTEDDITKSVLANFFQKDIIEDQRALEVVTDNYKNFEKIPILKQNGYETIPEGFDPIRNPAGLAPGLLYKFSQHKKLIVACPGVPHEFQQMIEKEIWPKASEHFTQKNILRERVTIRTRNLPEEKIFFEICPGLWEKLSQFGQVSSLPHPLGVDIAISIAHKNKKEFETKKQKILDLVYETDIAPAIWQIGELEIEEFIIEEAKKKNLTIGSIESCTGGDIASKFTNISGVSAVFMGSITSYDNSVKMNVANVPKDIIEKYGAVSEECVGAMAKGGREALGVDIAVATSGIAGPSGGTKEKPVGLVTIGIASCDGIKTYSFRFTGNRLHLKKRFTQMALYLLLEEVQR